MTVAEWKRMEIRKAEKAVAEAAVDLLDAENRLKALRQIRPGKGSRKAWLKQSITTHRDR